MENAKAIELLNKALRCVQTDPRNCGECKKCENYATKEDGIEAIRMAISALEGKDTNVPANSALDHIHNVVAEREYQRGHEQAKAEYDHKLTVIKNTIKDYYYIKGCEDTKAKAIPIDWIEAEIKKLRDMDNGFASLSAGQIEAMLKKWREEQGGEQHGQE